MIVRVLILIAVLSGLSACSQTSRGSYCQNSSPIRLTKQTIEQMTPEEREEILIRNALGAQLCGWRP